MTAFNDLNSIVKLLEQADLLELGYLAQETKRKIHLDQNIVTFVIDRNINYTNICSCKCSFCAFHKDKHDKNAYVLDYETIKSKIIELISLGGTQLLLQGGLNPDLPLNYYLELIKSIKADFPDLSIHSFSPSEICFIAENNNLSIESTLDKLIEIGLSSIPGAGAEILCDEIRKKLSPNKISSQKWLDIMEIAHLKGLKTTATMVFGFGENYSHIAEHLLKIKKLQAKTQGFTAFIPWTFAPFEKYFEKKANLNYTDITSYDYLRILAVSRIVLDNIPNIQASWVTQGLNIAQLSLMFGANDFGGTMLEENVVKAAGIKNNSSIDKILYNIKKAGFKPAQRDTNYNILKIFS